MTRIVCIVQARMGSTRLPGKVAMDIAGEPMLSRVVRRAALIDGIADLVVATSRHPGDDQVASLARRLDVPCFRGSEEDVLARYRDAAIEHRADVVVRVTADCPLLDPRVSSRVVAGYLREHPDYASNTLRRTYPRGLDTEVLGLDVLEIAHREATEKPDREHVTRFVWRQPRRFALWSEVGEFDHSSWRWTVDTADDLEFTRRIYGELDDPTAGMDEVLAVLERHPRWRFINAHVEQKTT